MTEDEKRGNFTKAHKSLSDKHFRDARLASAIDFHAFAKILRRIRPAVGPHDYWIAHAIRLSDVSRLHAFDTPSLHKKKGYKMLKSALAIAASVAIATNAYASVQVIGGSNLLTGAYASQLDAWL